jgi:hypothetical protein
MNLLSSTVLRRGLAAGVLAGLAWASAWAAPGAHGPDGEHLDAPGPAMGGATHPRLEAASELFELVAELKGGELVVLVDRYETNEPVLGAQLDVESGEHRARADFRAEHGDYVVASGPLTQALATPGEHPLVFTLTTADAADLLDGSFAVAERPGTTGAHDHGAGLHVHDGDLERALWVVAGVLALGALGATAWWRQRRPGAASLEGGQA